MSQPQLNIPPTHAGLSSAGDLSDIPLEKPDLCALSEDQERLELRAARCAACGGLSFPVVNYGCPICGAVPDQTGEQRLSGRVKLLEFITIHGQIAPGVVPPIVVGEAELAPGLIEEIAIGVDEAQLSLGMVLQAMPVVLQTARGDRIACRFFPLKSPTEGDRP